MYNLYVKHTDYYEYIILCVFMFESEISNKIQLQQKACIYLKYYCDPEQR